MLVSVSEPWTARFKDIPRRFWSKLGLCTRVSSEELLTGLGRSRPKTEASRLRPVLHVSVECEAKLRGSSHWAYTYAQ